MAQVLTQTQGFTSANDETSARQHFQGREMRVYHGNDPRFDGVSSYREDYPAHAIEPRPAVPPTQYAGTGVAFDGQSTYKDVYKAHVIPDRPPARPGQPHQMLPFEGTSSYKGDYPAHPYDPTRQGGTVGDLARRPSVPFDSTTSYSQDYPHHPIQAQNRAGPASAPYNPIPFEGSSTYKNAYQPVDIPPRAYPANYGLAIDPRTSAPFDGTTTNREAYKAYQIEPRPAGSTRGYMHTTVPFDGSTEARDRFRGAQNPLDQHAQHAQAPPMRPQLPFDGTTTTGQAFRGWQLPPRRPALGVQVLGDSMHILITPAAQLPAAGSQIFTTVYDNQQELCVLVLRGDGTTAAQCSVMGQFDLTGLPPGPKGTVRMEVVFHLDAQSVLSVTATDMDTQRQMQWLGQGAMVARKHSNDVHVV